MSSSAKGTLALGDPGIPPEGVLPVMGITAGAPAHLSRTGNPHHPNGLPRDHPRDKSLTKPSGTIPQTILMRNLTMQDMLLY